MTKKTKNPLLNYENKWVALTPDNKRVIASDDDFKKLHEKLLKMKVKRDEVVMSFVRPFDGYLVV